MALGKITIVIGAGIIGSILSKEGQLSDVTNFFSGALRIFTKHLHQDKDGSQSAAKPRNDALLAQVNSLRQELQQLASSRSITIITRTKSGSRAYGVTTILIVGCLGYGYIWWKGWRFSDMMFVTRRGFSNACSAVGKQLDHVSSSITSAKRHLSSKIDVVDDNLDQMRQLTASTKNEVNLLHGDTSLVQIDVESVSRAVSNLKLKMDQLDEGQNFAGRGLYALCKFAEGWQQGMIKGPVKDSPSSSLQALEASERLGDSRTRSLPPSSLEQPSPSSMSPRVLRPSITVSAAGLKELQEVSNPPRLGNLRTSPKSASNASTFVNEPSSSTSNAGRFGWKIPGISVLSRTRSNAN
ncbi:hypothetical protein HPP92_008062 [Vanilla planifolia]|uniref:DUF1664 domain-containing protein n=1 Tax=Vanilla planifolia TaxID=51239 RepID=A0A835VAM7_VANPL|nr:hypothetical protein HPP92_008062 [Vanilla planifolia]